MKISEIITELEKTAPPSLQESYDNAGLITGDSSWYCTGAICTLDATEEIVQEAVAKKCNLIIAHHPIIFSGLKKINGKNYVEKAIITAIKNDIAIYAIHTNLDNIINGVNRTIADKLNLINRSILLPRANLLSKLYTFAPTAFAEKIRNEMFNAGAGSIGNYSECSFIAAGTGTYKPEENTHPFLGEKGKRHEENEIKIEVVFPNYLQNEIVSALLKAHPYEEVAYDIVALKNDFQQTGSGMTGELNEELSEFDFLNIIKNAFQLSIIKHTKLTGRKVKKVAVCGGSGSFLIKNALAQNADFYITSDIKYHEFFDAENKMVIADIGHWESEQFAIDLLFDILRAKFSNFAVRKSETVTNPVNYFF